MKIESAYRILVLLLLAAILAVQIAIFARTQKPVTIAEFSKDDLTDEKPIELFQRIPFVRVNGEIDVNVQNSVEILR